MKTVNLVQINNIKGKPGEFGYHDGFFNTIVTVGVEDFHLQCCTETDGTVDIDYCEYNKGMNREVNEPLADELGWDELKVLIIICTATFN